MKANGGSPRKGLGFSVRPQKDQQPQVQFEEEPEQRGHRRHPTAPSSLSDTVAASFAGRLSLTARSSSTSSSAAASAKLEAATALHNRSIGKSSSRRELPPLFWYMESGHWARAEQRARRHPREFKTWVTIKTKSSHAAVDESPGSTSSTSGTTDTKRLALHHACFKLRSVGSQPPPDRLQIIEGESEDPFVQVCRFILILINLYPEAAGQRETRHGCLPLHLAAFGSCASRSSAEHESETSSSVEAQQQPLARPSALSRRCASDTTNISVATNMSAMHAEETMSGGMKRWATTASPGHNNKLSVSVAMKTSNLKISPRREAVAVQVINALLDAYPRAIRIDSEGGRLPLHTACAGRATPRVVSTLITAYPAAARHRNKDGFLPLHLAAHWGVSHPAVAIALLKAYPDATVGRNRWERTPLEEALCMAGENGRPHQAALVRALRKHPSFWTQPVAELFHGEGTTTARRKNTPVDVDESLASTTEDDGDHDLYSPSPREKAILEESEFGQEVSYDEGDDDNGKLHAGGFVGRIVSGMKKGDASNKSPKQAIVHDVSLTLEQLIQNRQWQAVMDRIHTHVLEPEKELIVVTRGGFMASTGMTALHYTCERNPPVAVVEALIEAYPVAVLTRCMPGGCLPLHVACTWHCSPGVVDALLVADQGGCKIQDELGNVALHSATFSGADAAIVAALLETDPSTVVARNHQGSRPIDICKRLRHDNRKVVISMLSRKRDELLTKQRAQSSSGAWADAAREAEEPSYRG